MGIKCVLKSNFVVSNQVSADLGFRILCPRNYDKRGTAGDPYQIGIQRILLLSERARRIALRNFDLTDDTRFYNPLPLPGRSIYPLVGNARFHSINLTLSKWLTPRASVKRSSINTRVQTASLNQSIRLRIPKDNPKFGIHVASAPLTHIRENLSEFLLVDRLADNFEPKFTYINRNGI
ncbi:hypothetical protein RF11_07925 [Thelohanellus kitauei]|uniref:Uncharacterized protein n=1 Tax=Thelohanellus kitauei TaxID=669202 RepID=A0A0C2N3U8_THEKT|nr:hypothetical protein RF11_07925 [Thelohanellus kitauei]